LYTDWRSAGLSTSNDTELQAIAAGVDQAYDIGLEDIRQVHVFSDSTNALRLFMDASHHSGQPASLAICQLLVPWLKQHANNSVHLHHITPGVELEDHQLVHIHATSTRIEAGGEPTISADFARCEAVTCMLSGWNALFRTKKYVGSNFLALYQGKNTLLIPTHVNSGPWMRRMGHSHELTARLVRCITGHAPIRSFRSRFFPLESTACRCGPWRLCHTSFTDARYTNGKRNPARSCLTSGLSTFSLRMRARSRSTFTSLIQARGGTPAGL
jgi:hypothetical protein